MEDRGGDLVPTQTRGGCERWEVGGQQPNLSVPQPQRRFQKTLDQWPALRGEDRRFQSLNENREMCARVTRREMIQGGWRRDGNTAAAALSVWVGWLLRVGHTAQHFAIKVCTRMPSQQDRDVCMDGRMGVGVGGRFL